ncbi:hypothetical protein AAVH_19509, partial [Aphelenchoides avenae]
MSTQQYLISDYKRINFVRSSEEFRLNAAEASTSANCTRAELSGEEVRRFYEEVVSEPAKK